MPSCPLRSARGAPERLSGPRAWLHGHRRHAAADADGYGPLCPLSWLRLGLCARRCEGSSACPVLAPARVVRRVAWTPRRDHVMIEPDAIPNVLNDGSRLVQYRHPPLSLARTTGTQGTVGPQGATANEAEVNALEARPRGLCSGIDGLRTNQPLESTAWKDINEVVTEIRIQGGC
jgi:hypothetical protein